MTHLSRYTTQARKTEIIKHLSRDVGDIDEKKQLLQKAFTFNHRKRGSGFGVDDSDDFDDDKMNRSEFILEVIQSSRFVLGLSLSLNASLESLYFRL